MRRQTVTLALIVMTAAGFVAGLLVASRMQRVQAQAKPIPAFPAVPSQRAARTSPGLTNP